MEYSDLLKASAEIDAELLRNEIACKNIKRHIEKINVEMKVIDIQNETLSKQIEEAEKSKELAEQAMVLETKYYLDLIVETTKLEHKLKYEESKLTVKKLDCDTYCKKIDDQIKMITEEEMKKQPNYNEYLEVTKTYENFKKELEEISQSTLKIKEEIKKENERQMKERNEIIVKLAAIVLDNKYKKELEELKQQTNALYEHIYNELIERKDKSRAMIRSKMNPPVGSIKPQLPSISEAEKKMKQMPSKVRFADPRNHLQEANAEFLMTEAKRPKLKQTIEVEQPSCSYNSADSFAQSSSGIKPNPKHVQMLQDITFKAPKGVKFAEAFAEKTSGSDKSFNEFGPFNFGGDNFFNDLSTSNDDEIMDFGNFGADCGKMSPIDQNDMFPF